MKKTLSLILALSLMLSLAACGSAASVKTSSPEEEEVVALETEAEETAVPDTEAAAETEETAVPDTEAAETETAADEVVAAESIRPLNIETTGSYETLETGDERWDWINYEVPSLDAEAAGTYPALNSALETYAKSLTDTMKQDGEDIVSGLKEYETEEALFSEAKLTIQRADSALVSLLCQRGSYMGGAHPNMWYETASFSPETGEKVDIQSVVNDPDALPALLAEEVEKVIDKEQLIVDSVEDVVKDEMDPAQEDYDLKYTLGYDGITFWFSPYELAAYAAGPVVIKLPFSEYPDLVRAEFMETPENYFIPVNETEQVLLPSGDAYFSWYLGEGEDYEDRDLHLVTSSEWHLNLAEGDKDMLAASSETDVPFTIQTFEPSAYIMQVDGKTMFVMEAAMMDDYSELHLYDLTDPGAPTELPVIARYFGKGQPTDPKRVYLSHGVDILSTYTAGRYFSFKADGTAEPLSDWDDIILFNPDAYNITLKQDTELPAVDEKTLEAGAPVSLAAGTHLTFIRTDSENTVDMKTDDGTVVRITQEGEEWPRTVNGIPIDELFDGMMFAG